MLDTSSHRAGFPSHAVSKLEKQDLKYGKQVANAIEHEWFQKDSGAVRFFSTRAEYHRQRLYARGEQPVQKYKDELAIDGDLSYMNLDWTPIAIIPKFKDIVVNGISDRPWGINLYAQDPTSIQKRTSYIEGMIKDMKNRALYEAMDSELGINMFQNDPATVPYDEDELAMHMQLDYKESIEIAGEEAISNIFALNRYDLIKRRMDGDLFDIGICCGKHSFNPSEGVTMNYVDPSDLIYSHANSPYFEDDLYYVGEVRRISIPQLKKMYPHLDETTIKDLERRYATGELGFTANQTDKTTEDGYVYVMFFEYKTYENQVYKIKHTATGSEKVIEKPDTFMDAKTEGARFERSARSIEVIYNGAKIVGTEIMLDWQLAKNMTRPKSDITRVNFSYAIVAPNMYQGRPESMVSRMIPFADKIQVAHMKLQQHVNRLAPDGVFLDADGLNSINLGGGRKYSPREALNMYFQTGSVIGRSFTEDGDFNHGKIPVQPISSPAGSAKIDAFIRVYHHYLQMIRDVTGLNEARDGSTPDKMTLVGVQKLAAANSNTATRHIVHAGMYVTAKLAEGCMLRVSDVLEYSNTRESFINSLGRFNMATLAEIKELHLHDFGIFIELAPDEEEKAQLEANMQISLNKEQIEMEDVIDIREVRNLKLANQLLKVRRRKRKEERRQEQMQNIQAQANANGEAAERKALAEAQAEQIKAQSEIQVATSLSELKKAEISHEAKEKERLMGIEFNYNIQLKSAEYGVINEKEKMKEDRKDKRTKIQAGQQSKMIEQRNQGGEAIDFESAGNDELQGFDLGLNN